jgi:hypothetical protein
MLLELILGSEADVRFLQILTYFVNFDSPEWTLLEQVDMWL